MAKMNITLPAMGEGVIEATIIKWLVTEGSQVKEDDPLVEVATDKVDSEVPAPVSGTIVSINAKDGSTPKIGDLLAVIESSESPTKEDQKMVDKEVERVRVTIASVKQEKAETEEADKQKQTGTEEPVKQEKTEKADQSNNMKSRTPSGKFISPLVKSIATREQISITELEKITGTGMEGRITKNDIFRIIEDRKTAKGTVKSAGASEEEKVTRTLKPIETGPVVRTPGDEIIPMDRVRKIIAEHMVMSKRTSPHVTSFIDADVTRLVNWRNANKDKFLADEGQKLTLTPFFIEAAAKALYELPMVNVSVDGDNIIKRKNINIGMATALPNGNLIVPVIKNANEKSLTGIAKAVNDLAERARNSKLKPDEITGGTFSITNFGSYDNLAGTPIINQPQAAILGTGVVRKTPVVIETPDGDTIAIRQIMILSLSYDHRVIDGALAGKFLHKVKEILENYSPDPS